METGSTGFQPVRTFRIYKRNLPHWEQPGSVYFITFRTSKGIILFDKSKDIIFEANLFHNNKKYKFYAIVILKDHVHIILQPLEKTKDAYYSIREITHSIKSFSANKINRQLQRKGSVWLDESFDRIIRNEKEFIQKLNYVVNNPIKSNLVENIEDYKWIYIEGWNK
jgi:REP element-mobilizing transposase RayT